MKPGRRRTFTPEFKVKVVLCLIRGDYSLSEASAKFSVGETALSRWKQEFLERAPQLFGSSADPSGAAKIESLEGSARSKEDEADRRYQQDGLSVQWTLIALAVQALLTGAVVFGLPWLIRAIDFEGGNGMIVCIPVWFVGGLLVGMISPGRTFIEPMIAAFLVAIPSTYLLHASQTVRTLPAFLYVILGGIGVLFTLIGSYLGERWQLVTPKKA